MALIEPHGGRGLVCSLLTGAELEAETIKAKTLKQIRVTSRSTSDLCMMGIGAFSPLHGFMTKKDWKGVCENFTMADGTVWPIPITVDCTKEDADAIKPDSEITLVDEETGTMMATMKVVEKYEMTEADKSWECMQVFTTDDIAGHPGVEKVHKQKAVNLAGPVKVLSELDYRERFPGIYKTPAELRQMITDKGWSTVAALQLRNPMHRSHEYLAKIAVEVCDGIVIHSLIGALKSGDIPADTRLKCIDALVENYFTKEHVLQAGYPMEMRYGGPREALLHATFRQNYGISHLIVGRDHAGVGDYYGMFDAQTIFDKIPQGEGGKYLKTKPLKIDWTFYCMKCDGMASMRTCPHTKADRVILSGTKLRKMLSEGEEIPDHFGRKEVLDILREYYAGLTEKVEIKMQKFATGEEMK
ncbi:MAG: sulfate adenylyltransferase [Deltaproteobacteria bacterium]|jgi:sulfate adenylyltransferase|nr:MAG: sulfate adenylyltransferase [Deltaproteobacteria bacterium]